MFIFYNFQNLCILQGQVFVMDVFCSCGVMATKQFEEYLGGVYAEYHESSFVSEKNFICHVLQYNTHRLS